MTRLLVLLSFFTLITNPVFAAEFSCDSVANPASVVSDPLSLSVSSPAPNPNLIGYTNWSRKYMTFLCGQNPDLETQAKCKTLGTQIISATLSCQQSHGTILNTVAATAFMRNETFKSYVLNFILLKDNTPESNLIESIWNQYGVLLLRKGKQVTYFGETQDWSLSEIKLIQKSLALLEKYIGWSNSHLWNFGGLMARAGKKTVNGQFGAVHPYAPYLIAIVTDIANDGFSEKRAAERLVHESAHSWDNLIGDGRRLWTETNEPNVYKYCNILTDLQPSLYECRNKNLS